MSTFRVGNHWRRHTIILEGVLPADAQGRREDDRPVAFVDSAAPEGLAERICALLNFEPELVKAARDQCGCLGGILFDWTRWDDL